MSADKRQKPSVKSANDAVRVISLLEWRGKTCLATLIFTHCFNPSEFLLHFFLAIHPKYKYY